MKPIIFLALFFSLIVLYAPADTVHFSNTVTITASITVIPANLTLSNTNVSAITAPSNQSHISDLTSTIISMIYNRTLAQNTYVGNMLSGTFETVFGTGENLVQFLKPHSV